MRIEKLILENFAGIWAGMNRLKIEIDFPKTGNIITMLSGANGSGKTTIMSQLHPFKKSYDERKNPILPGRDGYKEIHIRKDDDLYVIKHYYFEDKGDKSYISKNGVELNESGGIRTFMSIVEEELDVTEDYFRIGRIGNNVINFIDLSTGMRKDYISKFLPDVEDYLRYFRIVNDKFRSLKKEITYLTDQLDKMDSEEGMESLKQSLMERLEDREKELAEVRRTISQNEGVIKQIDPDGTLQTEGNPLKEIYLGSKKKLERAEEARDRFIESHSALANFDLNKTNAVLAKDRETLAVLIQEKESLISTLEGIKASIVETYNSLVEKKRDLEQYGDESDLEELKKIAQELEEEIQSLSNDSDDRFLVLEKYDQKTFAEFVYEMTRVKEVLFNIKSSYGEDVKEKFLSMAKEKTLNGEELEVKVTRLEEAVKKQEENVLKLNGHLNIMHEQSKKLDVLKLRPSACRIDSCAFIRDALRFKDIEEDIKRKEQEIEQAQKILTETREELEQTRDLLQIYKDLHKVHENLSTKGYLKTLADIGKDQFLVFNQFVLLVDLPSLELDALFNFSEPIKWLRDRDLLQSKNEKLLNVQERISLMEKQSSLLKSIKRDIDSLEVKVTELRDKESKIKTKVNEVTNKIEKTQKRIKILENLKETLETLDECSKKMKENEKEFLEYEKKIQDIKDLKQKNKDLEKDADYIEREIAPLKKRLEDVKLNIAKRQDFQVRLESVQENYDVMSMVRDALDPKRGIPVYFIGEYLKEVAVVTNELLDLALGGNFRIDPDIDDKNFFIRVRKGTGEVLEDIKEASQGEVALTSVSLSLAMVKQIVTDYNILCLDEIDGPLDSENRRHFIEMLEKQIKELGIEQVFVISHNNEFHAYPVDLILLRGHDMPIEDEDFMNGKNILFDFNTL